MRPGPQLPESSFLTLCKPPLRLSDSPGGGFFASIRFWRRRSRRDAPRAKRPDNTRFGFMQLFSNPASRPAHSLTVNCGFVQKTGCLLGGSRKICIKPKRVKIRAHGMRIRARIWCLPGHVFVRWRPAPAMCDNKRVCTSRAYPGALMCGPDFSTWPDIGRADTSKDRSWQ